MKWILKNFKLPEPLAYALEEAARIEERTQTTLVIRALKRYLAEEHGAERGKAGTKNSSVRPPPSNPATGTSD